jgi:hypothetical protein
MAEPYTSPYTSKARTFEQDLLWSVLDHVAVEHILAMARDDWGLDAATAWAAVQEQARLGRLRAYRESVPVDLTKMTLDQAAEDHVLFVEPTEATFARLNEMPEAAKS